jgi:hypothetical protein
MERSDSHIYHISGFRPTISRSTFFSREFEHSRLFHFRKQKRVTDAGFQNGDFDLLKYPEPYPNTLKSARNYTSYLIYDMYCRLKFTWLQQSTLQQSTLEPQSPA